MTGPAEFLEAAHKRAETVTRALPCGPWEWRAHSGPEDWYMALEGPDGVPVVRSQSRAGSSQLKWHPAFDEFLPEPEAVLRRIARERRTLEACAEILSDPDGWEYSDAPDLATATIRNLAEGWGWTEETTPSN